MGNWTTVNIVGTCGAEDIDALTKALTMDSDYGNFHCLINSGGMCGLPDWAREKIDVVGNLSERDYDADSVRRTLEEIAKTVPSLCVKVHVGGDYEDKNCVATVTLKGGKALITDPEIEEIREIEPMQMHGQFFNALMGQAPYQADSD